MRGLSQQLDYGSLTYHQQPVTLHQAHERRWPEQTCWMPELSYLERYSTAVAHRQFSTPLSSAAFRGLRADHEDCHDVGHRERRR